MFCSLLAALSLALPISLASEPVTVEVRPHADAGPTTSWVILWREGEGKDAEAWTDSSGRTWVRAASSHPSYPRDDERVFTFDVEPGDYIASATSYDPATKDPTPAAFTSPFEVVEGESSAVSMVALGGIPVTIHIVDAETMEPVSGIPFRVVHDQGVPIVHGDGSAVALDRTDDSGARTYQFLFPGRYAVDVFTREARVDHFVRYNEWPTRTYIHVRPEGSRHLHVEATPRRLTPEEIDAQFPFSATGRVTDTDGRPIADVEVRVATGRGTLLGGGSTRTDDQGRYQVHFTQGVWSDQGVGVQAASFFVSKDGWFETNLCRQGNCLMSDLEGEDLREGIANWGVEDLAQVARPGSPLEIDFVMAPAARISGRLETDRGRPVPDARCAVEGPELPPSSSVLTTFTTDDEGRFEIDLPVGYDWRFSVRVFTKWSDVRSPSMRFESGGPQDLRLVLDATESDEDGSAVVRLRRADD